jgi:flagellar basal body P-ring formation protein FlgA
MTHRHLHWLATLSKCSALCAPDAPSITRRAFLRAGLALIAGVLPAQAARLRSFNALGSSVIMLSDLFDGLDSAQDRPLGAAPLPGARIIVEAPQLAAIARDFGVAWRPATGAERAVLERAGTPLAMRKVTAALAVALAAMGAPTDADVELPGFEPPTVPTGADAQAAVAQVDFDAASGRFTALLSVTVADMDPIHARLSGTVTQMADAAMLTCHLRPGSILTADDLHTVRVRANLLHGNVALSPAEAVGQALRHDMPAGQPLTAADVMRPRLVARNDAVRMILDAGAIALNAQGVALEEGGLGERIRVQNPSSHAVVIGEITGGGEVRVTPGEAPILVAAQ